MSLSQIVTEAQDGCFAPMSFGAVTGVVISSCVLGLIWALFNMSLVNKIDVEKGDDG